MFNFLKGKNKAGKDQRSNAGSTEEQQLNNLLKDMEANPAKSMKDMEKYLEKLDEIANKPAKKA